MDIEGGEVEGGRGRDGKSEDSDGIRQGCDGIKLNNTKYTETITYKNTTT